MPAFVGSMRAVLLTPPPKKPAQGFTYLSNGLPDPGTVAQPLIRLNAGYGVTQSSGKVSAIADYGSIGTTLSQANGTLQPAYVTNAHNGHACLRFNKDSWLQVAAHLTALELTAFTLMTIGTNTDASGAGDRTLFGVRQSSQGFGMGDDSAFRWAGIAETFLVPSSTTGSALHAAIYRGTSAGGNEVYVDSTTFQNTGGSTRTPNTTSLLTLGCSPDGAAAGMWTGDFCEAFIWGSAITTTDMASALNYSRAWWGTP